MFTSFFKKIICFFFLVVLFVSPIFIDNAEAAINEEINYQARLLDGSGEPVADGNYSVEFNLYTVSTGGSEIWTETQSVVVTDGLFSTALGSVVSLASVNFNQALYLGVDIEADGEMSPRKKLGSVTAAFVADTLDNLDSTQFFRTDITNATNSATTSLSVKQSGAGNIADFVGTSGNSVFTIASGGNVGVGTSSPYARLSVAGQIASEFFTATSTTASSTLPKLATTDFSLAGLFYDTNGFAGQDGNVLQTTGGGVEWVATSTLGFAAGGGGGQGGDKYAVLVDEKADGTAGGTFTSGAWRTRDLNTERYDDIGVSISSNEFTLPAGTYEIDASAPAFRVGSHQTRLYNVTDAEVVVYGTSEKVGTAEEVIGSSLLNSIFTITEEKTFRIEHQSKSTNSTDGFGLETEPSGAPEIYTIVSLRKLGSGDGVFTASSSDAYITGGNISIGQTTGPNQLNVNGGIFIASTTPATTTNSLYNVGGTLYFNGSEIGTGGGGGQGGDKYAVLVDEKADGTHGGTATAGAWQTRDLNTEQYDDIGVSISSNEFTLPAGTYEINASVPTYLTIRHQSRLYNVTDAEVAFYGTSEFATNVSGADQVRSHMSGIVTVTEETTFRIEHRVQSTYATLGFGVAADFTGSPEIYTIVSLRKLGSGDGVFTASSSDAYITGGNISIGQTTGPNQLNVNGGIFIASTTPATTTNSLYNVGGTLYFNGSEIGTGGGGGQGGDKYAVLVDEKADGTAGGTATAGSWLGRDLNTEQYDDIGVSISSNEFTLPAGTYEIDAYVPGYRVQEYQSRLYNVTDAAVEVYGSSALSERGSGQTHSEISAIFTTDSEKTFRIEQRVDETESTSGYGRATTFTDSPEIYTVVSLRKLGSGDGVFTASSSDAYFTGGNIGIGTNVPTQLLHVKRDSDGVVARFQDSNGYCDINPTNTSLVCTSDARLKEAVRDLDDYNHLTGTASTSSSTIAITENESEQETTLDRLLQLRPVEFEWISDETNGKRYGFIAQEVEEIFPELVTTDEDSGYKSVAYGGFVPFVVQSIQELAEEQLALVSDVAEIQEQLTGLLAQIEILTVNTKAMIFGWMEFRNEKLCVDDVCIDKEEFKTLMKNSGGTTNNEFYDVSDSGSDTVTSLDDEEVVVDVATSSDDIAEKENDTVTSLDDDVVTSATSTDETIESTENGETETLAEEEEWVPEEPEEETEIPVESESPEDGAPSEASVEDEV